MLDRDQVQYARLRFLMAHINNLTSEIHQSCYDSNALYMYANTMINEHEVEIPDAVIYLNPRLTLEWYIVRCGYKNGDLKDMSKRVDYILNTHSRVNSQYN